MVSNGAAVTYVPQTFCAGTFTTTDFSVNRLEVQDGEGVMAATDRD